MEVSSFSPQIFLTLLLMQRAQLPEMSELTLMSGNITIFYKSMDKNLTALAKSIFSNRNFSENR